MGNPDSVSFPLSLRSDLNNFNLPLTSVTGPSDFPTIDCSSSSLSAASLGPLLSSHLLTHGACRLTNLVPPRLLQTCVSTADRHMPLRNGGPSYNDISPGYVASSANRWHLSMHKCRNEPAKATLAECERLWLDDWIPTFLRPGFSRTQFQLLRSEPGPGGADQGFHQDNSRRGLTVLVPLCDVPVERGPTQLLLGSHALTGAGGGRRGRRGAGGGAGLLTEAFDNLGAVLPRASLHAPALRKGDVLVYDSRVLHRGLENRDSEARPCLVFRYDEEGCAPPGHGPLSTVVFRQIGNALALLARL